ncbi:MAG: ribonuclease H-like domain-containing protein, partial [Bacteroidota bacterium]
MSRVVIDIESLAFPFASFDTSQQEYLLKFAATNREKEEALQKLNLFPTTARILAIGMVNPDTNAGLVLYQGEGTEQFSADHNARFVAGTEPELLHTFWDVLRRYDQFITFNGRAFDCPFLMLRSSILNIRPSRNLMPYRYDSSVHCDLLEQLTFYGTAKRFSLDFYCKTFGIESPKSRGITG